MQRKSIGHTRRPQGLHSTPRLTMRTRVPNGPVARSSVEPKMATSGIPSAAARCMGPESFVTINLHRAMSASNCRKEVSPAAIAGVCFMALAISSARGRSAADPKISTSAFNAPIRRSASPAKALGQPALGRAEGRSRSKAHEESRAAQSQRLHLFRGPILFRLGEAKPNFFDGLRLVDHARAKKELQVIIDLVPIGGRKGRFNGVVEQEAAAVARVPDAQRDARQPSHPGSLKRVLEKQGGVKALRPQFPDELGKPQRPAMLTRRAYR